MLIHITPKTTASVEDLVGLIVDPKDKRYGQIFLVGGISSDESRTCIYVHHICPDGTHYTSRNMHHQTPQMLIPRNLLPDVGPPEFYLRHNGEHPLNEIMRLQGRSVFDLERAYRAIKGEVKTMYRDYKILFQKPFPLE